MNNDVYALHGAIDSWDVADVADDLGDMGAHVGVGEVGEVQGGEFVSFGVQVPDEVDAKESGSASYQYMLLTHRCDSSSCIVFDDRS